MAPRWFKKKTPPSAVADAESAVSGSGDENVERGNWSSKVDFILSAVGFAVGLGNVWRFPYLCYRNGGGAFLIPYTIMLAVAGLPLFFMELAFGQFASLGPITIWKVAPLFKGLGYVMVVLSAMVAIYYNMILAYTIFYPYSCAPKCLGYVMVVLSAMVAIYYNMILAYTIYYLFASFTTRLPWADCGNAWNTLGCRLNPGELPAACVNSTSPLCQLNITSPKTPAEEYWENHVLELTDSVDNLGQIRWQLLLCLLLAWTVVFLCLIRGIKSIGKVVYFTAVFPYVVLTILLIRGVTLPGAIDGVRFYIIPDFNKLANAKVWGDAAVQIFYSLGPAWGGLITMGSYNKFNNNCYKDAILVATINCATSVYAGFAIFSVVGFMAHTLQLPIENATASGPGLAFVAYPEGIARMPGAPFWSVIFFFMLWTLGLDSMFAMMETVIAAFVDEFPEKLRKKKLYVTLGLCVAFFLLGIVMCTQGGMYILNLLDWYSASYSLMITSLLEVLVLMYIYGYHRFVADIESMIGFRPNAYWRMTWMLFSPMSIIFIIIFLIVDYSPLKLNDYVYPVWANGVGWGLVLFSFAFIPGLMVVALVKEVKANGWRGPCTMLSSASRSTEDWGPALKKHWRITERGTQTGEKAETGLVIGPSKPNYNVYDNKALECDEGDQFSKDVITKTKI